MKKLALNLFVIIFAISIYSNAFSQKITVYNEINDFPVPGVSVFNDDRTTVCVTSDEGIFRLENFSYKDSIIFRHVAFRQISLKKEDIIKGDYKVYITPNELLLSEIRIVGSNDRENVKELPYKFDKLQTEQIINSSSHTSADILISTGNVIVQKSQGGGGSPVIRGFEANKILLVLDGVRMNNAIYRSGHLQNSITIDKSILEKVNIIYGPSSIIYGSDALGGVVHYFTKQPKLAVNNAFPAINFFSSDKYSTADNSYIRHSDINIGYKHIASLSSFTYSKFDEIEIGKNRAFSGGNQEWGYNKYYFQRLMGKDSTVKNSEPLIQKRTGYTQYDFLQKIKITPNKNIDIVANMQYSTSSDINRYDNLTSFKDNNLKYADWYYGPQKRLMTSLNTFLKPNKNPLLTNVKIIFAYQQIEESRHQRKFGKDEILKQFENLDIYSLNIDFLKIIDISRLSYGFEIYHNKVNSEAYYQNIYDNSKLSAQTRYPNGGSLMTNFAVYTNYKWLINEKNIVTSGIRYSYTDLYSKFINTEGLVQLPFSDVNISNGAPTGSLSYIWFPNSKWRFGITGSTGFRTPNIDDYGKIRAKDDLVTVPYDKLKPEYAYNAEIGITKFFGENVKINLTGFYTWLDNAIVRDFYSLNGNDSLEYDGDNYRIITNINSGRAALRGISLSIDGDMQLGEKLNNSIKFKGTINYTQGIDISNNVPLGHIPPIYGITSISYQSKKVNFNASFIYNFMKKTSEMSPFGEDNDEQVLPEGFPAWYTLNASISYVLTKRIKFKISVENIMDQHYRPFASGISAPGRNFVFTFFANV